LPYVSALRSSMTPRAVLVAGVSLVLGALLAAHTEGMNGPSYYRWAWRDLSFLRSALPAVTVLGLVLVAQWARERRGLGDAAALALAQSAMLAGTLLAVVAQSPATGLERLATILKDPVTTGFVTDARRSLAREDWMATYAKRPTTLENHSMTKPPGAVAVSRLFLRTFGERGPLALGLALAMLASLVVPATWLFSRAAGASREAAFASATLVALMPGPVLFCPSFDLLHPLLVCAMLGCWVRSLDRRCVRLALASGAFLAVQTFFAFHPLVVGVFYAGAGLLWLGGGGRDEAAERAKVLVRQGALCLLVVVLWTAGLGLWSGYHAVEGFRFALSNQQWLLRFVPRPWPRSIAFDLVDFAMGVGWIPLGLAVAGAFRRLRRPGWADPVARLGLLVLVQVLVVAATGLIPGETARVWIFLMPLVAFAAGPELSSWSLGERAVVAASMALLLTAVLGNLTFFEA
jgi:hypothetical protein